MNIVNTGSRFEIFGTFCFVQGDFEGPGKVGGQRPLKSRETRDWVPV
jgi:hypothetical protein